MACGVAFVACAGEDAQPAKAPTSLVLVTLDTTRADHLTPYGADPRATPHLAALARSGAVFERAYATAPTTLPTHASLLTGLLPPRHGVRHNGAYALDRGFTTLAELLRDQGYATGAFVSSAVLERRFGLDQGFDVYDDRASAQRLALGRYAERRAGETVGLAGAWLDGLRESEPFFLWVHLYDPHAEYAPPPPWAASHAADPYAGEIAYVDAQLGHLLEHPRMSGALLSVIADHGESLGEHGEANHGLLLYEAVMRVPWILCGPTVPAERRSDLGVSQVDVLPTLLDLLGVALPADLVLDGRSAVPGLAESAGPADEGAPGFLYAEAMSPFLTYGWAPLYSVRRDRWKLISGPHPELYDTVDDPQERQNRIEDETTIARALAEQLGRVLRVGEALPGQAAIDPEVEARLRSLGYVTALQPESARGDAASLPDPKAMIDLHRRIGEAQQASLRGEPQAAVGELETVLRRDPRNLAALESLGVALSRLGRVEEASRAFARALDLAPDRVPVLLGAASLQARRGDVEGALETAERAIEGEPQSAEAQVAAATYSRLLGRVDVAKTHAAQALELSPSLATAQILYAQLVDQPADPAAAERRLRALSQQEPLLPEVWVALGDLLRGRGRQAEAVQAYRSGIERQPQAGELHAALGVALAQMRDPEAAAVLRRAESLLDPVPAEVHHGLALVALGSSRWSAAEQQARAALERRPADAVALNLLAAALEEQGRLDAALDAYDRARAAGPEHRPALFNRALLLRRMQRFEEAAAQLEELLALDPQAANAHYELGLLYGGPLGEPAAARGHLQAALDGGHPRADLIRRLLAELDAGG